jgi:hypothetical protein
MSVTPATTLPLFEAGMAGNSLIGSEVTQLATGLANGISIYVQSGLIVESIDAGTLGAGTGIGIGISLPEPTILAAISSFMSGEDILGQMAFPLASAIAFGISASFGIAQVSTINPTVGVGAGKLQLVPVGTGAAIFASAFAGSGLIGTSSPRLSSAVGAGLDSIVAASIGVITIVGSPSNIPSSGLGIGRIL